jgi:photosystem II stability/assembly factor-like uncharacterized protein
LPVRVFLGVLLSLLAVRTASGQLWQRLGPPGGNVITLGTGSEGVVYLGTSDGHVFAKKVDSQPWELRGRIGTRTDAVVSRLVADPAKSRTLFASVWYQQLGVGGGVFRSEDDGRSWRLLGLPNEAVRALEFSTTKPQILIAGTLSGVFRSSDSGNTWERISPENDPELRNVDSLAIDPRDPNVLYVGTYHLPWKSTDGGKTWKSITAGLIDDSDIMSLRVDAANPERIFLSACSGIYRSENQGSLWTKLQGIPYAARRTHSIVQDLQDPQTLYAGTTQGLWVTRDAGESWDRTTPETLVINSVAVVPGTSNSQEHLFIGTESRGVLASRDGGKSFVEENDGFTHQVVQQLVADPLDTNHLAMTMKSDGIFLWQSSDSGGSWSPLPLPQRTDKKEAGFAPETVGTIYGSPWGWMVRLYNGKLWLLDERQPKWIEWKLRLPETPVSGSLPTKSAGATKKPGAIQPLSPAGEIVEFSRENAYVPTKAGLLRCDAKGNCERLKGFGRGGQYSALLVSTDGTEIRAVVDGKLANSGDGGASAAWRDLPVANDSVRWIASYGREADTRLFLGTLRGLLNSSDGGTTWKRVGHGLADGQVELFLHGHGFLAAALRQGGFYISRDDGQTWAREIQDAERSPFTGMVETSPGILTIGSQSEGVLRWGSQPEKE